MHPARLTATIVVPLGIIVINHGTEPIRIEHGQRIAQAVIAPVVQARFRTGRGAWRDGPCHRWLRLDRYVMIFLFLGLAIALWVSWEAPVKYTAIGSRPDDRASLHRISWACACDGKDQPSAGEWAAVGVGALCVWAYSVFIKKVRSNVRPEKIGRPDDSQQHAARNWNATRVTSFCAKSAGRARNA